MADLCRRFWLYLMLAPFAEVVRRFGYISAAALWVAAPHLAEPWANLARWQALGSVGGALLLWARDPQVRRTAGTILGEAH